MSFDSYQAPSTEMVHVPTSNGDTHYETLLVTQSMFVYLFSRTPAFSIGHLFPGFSSLDLSGEYPAIVSAEEGTISFFPKDMSAIDLWHRAIGTEYSVDREKKALRFVHTGDETLYATYGGTDPVDPGAYVNIDPGGEYASCTVLEALLPFAHAPDNVFQTDALVSTGSAADPYIFQVCGPPVKVPDEYGMYRMYQHRESGVYVGIVVDKRDVLLHPSACTSSGEKPVRWGYYITSLHLRDAEGVTSTPRRRPVYRIRAWSGAATVSCPVPRTRHPRNWGESSTVPTGPGPSGLDRWHGSRSGSTRIPRSSMLLSGTSRNNRTGTSTAWSTVTTTRRCTNPVTKPGMSRSFHVTPSPAYAHGLS